MGRLAVFGDVGIGRTGIGLGATVSLGATAEPGEAAGLVATVDLVVVVGLVATIGLVVGVDLAEADARRVGPAEAGAFQEPPPIAGSPEAGLGHQVEGSASPDEATIRRFDCAPVAGGRAEVGPFGATGAL